MPRTIVLLVLALFGSTPALANEATSTVQKDAHRSDLAVGVALGHPTSLIIYKDLAHPKLSLQGGVGTGVLNGSGFHFFADLHYTATVASESATLRVPLYVGGGLRYYRHFYEQVSRYEEGVDDHLGLRVPFGLELQFKTKPFDIFFEGAVVMDLIQNEGCSINTVSNVLCNHQQRLEAQVSVGLRYYIGGK